MKKSTNRANLVIPRWQIILLTMYKHPGMTVSELAREIGVSYSTTFRTVCFFDEKLKFIDRVLKNEMKFLLYLNDQGKTTAKNLSLFLEKLGISIRSDDFIVKLKNGIRN